MTTVLTTLRARGTAALLAVLMVAVVAGCSGPDPAPEADRSPTPAPPTTISATTDASPATGTPGAGESVAVDDDTLVEGLRGQGYQCDDAVRCERVKQQVTEVIELTPGRLVFRVTATEGSPQLPTALASVLDDYGAVLPHRTFAGTDWDQFPAWLAQHDGDEQAEQTIAGWQASLTSEGSTSRTLVLALP